MKKDKSFVLSGRNIYYDKHDRAIYYNKRNRIGYIIPKAFERTFQNFQNRYVIGLIVFIFINILFNINIYISLGVSAVAVAFLEYKYQNSLRNMTQIANFNFKNAKKSIEELQEMSKGAIILRAILYFLLSILIILNLYLSKELYSNIPVVIACFILSFAALYMGIKNMMVVFKRKQVK
ncbi:MAG: hypothetical protein ACK5KQ_03475 [Anaerorhabdus sp.]